MDLQKLEAELRALQEQYQQWMAPIRQIEEDTRRKVGHDGYTEEDGRKEIEAVYQQQRIIYNPHLAILPLLNDVLSAYVVVTAEERAAIRDIFGKLYYASGALLSYILECAECLETPEDEDAFRLAMVAASIEDYTSDFRDTDAVLAELAIAAVKAGIDILPHCTAIAELSSATPGKGGRAMKPVLANFHLYAPKAVRLIDFHWLR